ncbi:hypothetical protein AAFC00_006342 [Neodothiora populina]|uniref:NADH:flavin oxidoreductase/NADH oxidase N-terminal domain-containing protein n=1 Tax=Neodothiora populina TaxID=2781224 RepID=A0ABR3P573_9PEZI
MTTTAHHNVQPAAEEPHNVNRAAPGISYFTPLQDPVAGTGLVSDDSKKVPKLFTPLKLRGLTLQNRIMLAPMCQYSAEDGHMTDWHLTHYGGIIQRGPGISCIEATAITPEGRITPEDLGIWKDSQIAPMKRLNEFAHSQGQKTMIQLAHAGRKASAVAPWLSGGALAGPELNGWPDNVIAPSAIAWSDKFAVPKAMTLEDIEKFKADYKAAVLRSLEAGFDAIEIHSAHGYLLHSFLSPVSNKRTDKYGGSWENRTRLLIEVAELVRSVIPETMPLFVRISGTDWLEEVEGFTESWTPADTAKVAVILAEKGVDLLDVSSGGSSPKQHPHVTAAYQAPFALLAKKAVGDKMAVGTVGTIYDGKIANQVLEEGLDLAAVGRGFQKNPGLVFSFADDLETHVQMPNQIRWGFGGRGKSVATKAIT